MIPRIAIPIPTLADHEYNLRSWKAYAEAVQQAGGEAVEISLTTTDRELDRLVASCLGILLPGSGADVAPERYGHERLPECADADPARERVDLRLIEHAEQVRKPLLCICFGTQMLNVWRGGTLVQDLSILPVNHRAGRGVVVAHTIAIAPNSVLGRIVKEEEGPMQDGFLRLPVNSSHHQAIGVPGQRLRIVARCPQDAVVEAVEGDDPEHFVLGVQWHPERTCAESATSRALFKRFLLEAGKQV